MFSGDMAQKYAVCTENGERKRQIQYCSTTYNHIDNDLKQSQSDTPKSISYTTKHINETDSDFELDDTGEQKVDKLFDKNYNCHYKVKAVQMSAIRCRFDETQQQQQQHQTHSQLEEDRKIFYQQHQQHLRDNNIQSVINLTRSNTIFDAMCNPEAYNLTNTTPHISYTSMQHQQHPQHTPTYGAKKEENILGLQYSNSTSPNPGRLANSPVSLTTVPSATTPTTVHDEDSNATTITATTNGNNTTPGGSAAAAAAANRRDHNIDYSTLFVQLSGTLPTLYRCVNCNKIVSNRWHHANIHRPQSHVCPVCGQKFTRRDNMKAHCKIKHADIKDRFFSHYVHM